MKFAKGLALTIAWLASLVPLLLLLAALVLPCDGWGCFGNGVMVGAAAGLSVAVSVALLVLTVAMYVWRLRWKLIVPILATAITPGALIAVLELFG